MKQLLTLEEAGQLILAIIALYLQPLSFSWWLWPILFLLPDIGILAYAAGPRVGAFFYNLLHHKGIATAVILGGYFYEMPYMLLAGLILYGHSAFDRVCGYGLKYPDSFKNTHLGRIGK